MAKIATSIPRCATLLLNPDISSIFSDFVAWETNTVVRMSKADTNASTMIIVTAAKYPEVKFAFNPANPKAINVNPIMPEMEYAMTR